MKTKRHAKILELIQTHAIDTQEELLNWLRQENFDVTQATVSRDIKELRLVKVLGKNGAYHYATAAKSDNGLSERLIRMFSETVLSITCAYNQIILRTISGSANIAAETIDRLQWPEVLGTIAGDNTILLIVRTIEETGVLMERLNDMMHRS